MCFWAIYLSLHWPALVTRFTLCWPAFICSQMSGPHGDKTDTAIEYLHGSVHRAVLCFSEGSLMITWRCYYCISNFHKHVWLTADCPGGRLDLRQENNEQNITWLVIREIVFGEDISSKVHCVLLLLATACTDKFAQWYIELRWADMWDLHFSQERLLSAHFHSHVDLFTLLLFINQSHHLTLCCLDLIWLIVIYNIR